MKDPNNVFTEKDRIAHLVRPHAQVIGGLHYNTKGATLIGVKLHPNGGDGRQGGEADECLFRTAKGAHFLSKGKLFSNRTSRLALEPLTDEKALEWAEKNLDAATIKRHFANVKDAVAKAAKAVKFPVVLRGNKATADRVRAMSETSFEFMHPNWNGHRETFDSKDAKCVAVLLSREVTPTTIEPDVGLFKFDSIRGVAAFVRVDRWFEFGRWQQAARPSPPEPVHGWLEFHGVSVEAVDAIMEGADLSGKEAPEARADSVPPNATVAKRNRPAVPPGPIRSGDRFRALASASK